MGSDQRGTGRRTGPGVQTQAPEARRYVTPATRRYVTPATRRHVAPTAGRHVAPTARPGAQRPPSVTPKTSARDQTSVVASATRFALDLYARLRQKKGNLFLSPWSITTALAMTYAGAHGNTAVQMAKVLHFHMAQSRLHPAIGAIQAQLKSTKDSELAIANRIYPELDVALLPAFVRLIKTAYGSALRQLDYKKHPRISRKTINAWVEHMTRGRIRTLLHDGDINADTRMVLVNAIYFKGRWIHQFPKHATRPADFHTTSGKTATIPMMHQQSMFRYRSLPDMQLLELPYAGNRLSMVILLPRRTRGLTAIEKGLSVGKLNRMLSLLRLQKVNLYLPRFKLGTRFELGKALKVLGMPQAFSDAADFRNMTRSEPIKISKVIHQANCDVTEKGTVAAAATAVVMVRIVAKSPAPPVFRADHPFLFLIRDHTTGVILFLGRLVRPQP